MEQITVNVTEKQIQDGIEKCIAEALKSTYNNPINTAVQNALKEKEGIIKQFVDDMIAKAISDPQFKTKLADAVLSNMIQLAMKK